MRKSLCLSVLLLCSAAWAVSPNPYLPQAKVFHQGLDFEKCLKRLDQASKWPNTPTEQGEMFLYYGLCHLALGHERSASEAFDRGIRADRNLTLPPLQGPKVTKLFKQVRDKVLPTLPPEPKVEPPPVVVTPPADAPVVTPITPKVETPVVVLPPPKPPTRWAAPAALGGVAVVAAGAGAYFGVQAQSYQAQVNDPNQFASEIPRLSSAARQNALMANVAFGVAGAAAVAAVVTYFVQN